MGFLQNSLTSAIYDLSLGRSTWDNILDLLGASLPGCLILVSGDDLASHANLVFSQRGPQPLGPASFPGPHAVSNPWLAGIGNLAVNQVYQDEQVLPRAQAKASPYWTKWLSHQGDFGAATGVVVLRDGARQLTIEVRYSEADQSGLRERATSLLAEAAYHFQRAFEIASRLRFSTGGSYLDSLVEGLPFAVFLLDRDLRIKYTNLHAENLRRRLSGPFTTEDGVLRVADTQADAKLRHNVQKMVTANRPATSVLQIALSQPEQRYFTIARLAGRPTQRHQLHDVLLDTGPLVMLVVHGSRDLADLPMDLVWRAFSLTESEARLAQALLEGATLAEFAMDREVSKQTLRNQLVGVMRKTGTRRQSELVSLLTRLALACL